MTTRNDRKGGPVSNRKTALTTAGEVVLVVALTALLAGLVAWLWTGEWRWAVTGVAVLFVGIVALTLPPGRTDR